jgi:DNA-binding GntR family transcriptional regulator
MPMTKNTHKETSEDIAYTEILKLIYERHFKPGDFLQENHLSETLGMSRTPINRALSKMTVEGILERKKKKGCFIPLVRPEEGKQLFSLRKIIEGQIAWEATHTCTQDILETLQQINMRDQQAIDEKNDAIYYSANRDFHFTLAEATNNKYLERICKQLFHQASIYIFFFDSFYRAPMDGMIETPIQHATILQFIEKKDAEGARTAMVNHIDHTMKMFNL